MKFYYILLSLSLVFCSCSYDSQLQWVDNYDIIWNKPSQDASESMPLGGGDMGCNVWVENGDILLYIQKSGCFSENGEYLKLGRIRFRLTPNIINSYKIFNQSLKLKDGSVYISAQDSIGRNFNARLWVDIFTQSLHCDITSSHDTRLEVLYENWRAKDKELTDVNRGRFGCFGLEGYPGKVIKKKDHVKFADNGILFYHKNDSSTLSPDIMIAQQGLSEHKDEITNNIKNLAFGGFISGTNLTCGSISEGNYCGTDYQAWSLHSQSPQTHHHVLLTTHIDQTSDLEKWLSELNKKVDLVTEQKGNVDENKKWWVNFWQQSWIITDPARKETDSLWEAGRNYQLFRYQLGCNLYGNYPSKFNGGNLIFDPVLVDSAKKHDPDWRQWGGDVFTAQNQRLLYWPMLKSGDFDGMISQFNLYKKGLKGAQLKVQHYFGHKGAMYCEYANDAGLDFAAGWGWDNSKIRLRGKELPFGSPEAKAINDYFQPVEYGIMASGSVSYHWESQVEHAYMILEYHRFTGRNIDEYIPFIKNALIFFDEHYQKRQMVRNGKPLDDNGKLVFYPSTSCESYRGAKNPADLMAGIRSCIEAILTLKSDSLSIQDKEYFSSYLNRLPDLYYDVIEGDTVIKPAESYIKYQNVECPQFYPLFPFNRFDFDSPMIPIFQNTWKHGTFPKNMVISWHQDGIFYARMGMTREAYQYNKKKLASSTRRFPTFWGPGHDWVPDHNWGGSGMIGLQEMLMQTVGTKIHILPSWPLDKDVHFKLHAPYNTTVEVNYKNGEIEKLEVYPKERENDIIIPQSLSKIN